MIAFIPRCTGARLDHFGLIAFMLSEDDPRPAREQLHDGYKHGGGWKSFKKFKMLQNEWLQYPGDPPMRPIGELRLRDERIVLYDCSWVVIFQSDGSYDVARMD